MRLVAAASALAGLVCVGVVVGAVLQQETSGSATAPAPAAAVLAPGPVVVIRDVTEPTPALTTPPPATAAPIAVAPLAASPAPAVPVPAAPTTVGQAVYGGPTPH